MPFKRLQFHKGFSLPEFVGRYRTQEQCAQGLVAARSPRGSSVRPAIHAVAHVVPPRGPNVRAAVRRLPVPGSRDQRHRVRATRLPLARWLPAMRLLTQAKNSFSALEPTRQVGVSFRTAFLVKHTPLPAPAASEQQFIGRVEIDDAYLGGQRCSGKAGRGSKNKAPFVVALQTAEEGRWHHARLSAWLFAQEAVCGLSPPAWACH